jgi:hypothetical protein
MTGMQISGENARVIVPSRKSPYNDQEYRIVQRYSCNHNEAIEA